MRIQDVGVPTCRDDCVLFAERANEFAVGCKAKGVIPGAVVKARVKCPIKYPTLDPKPSELTMSRLKSREIGMEGRTRECCKTLG